MPTTNIDYSRIDFTEALDYLSEKLNLDTDSYIEGESIVQDVAFTVAAAKGQLLQDIRDAMDRSIAAGESVDKFMGRFNNIAASYTDDWPLKGGNSWRGSLIYQQNIRQAYNAGRYQQMTDPEVMKLRPYWQWKHGNSEAPRLTHLALDGKVFPADSLPFFPPAGFNCLCSVHSLSQRDVDRRDLEVEDLELGQDLEVVDPSNGVKRTVKLEPDKGFDRIPGKSTPEQRAELIKRLDPELQKLVEAEASGEAEFAKLPEGTIRRRGGIDYVLRGSRWHRAETQIGEKAKDPPHLRTAAIYDLVDKFEADLQQAPDRDTAHEIADLFIHNLTQLNSRDEAERSAAKIDVSGLPSKHLQVQTQRVAADFYQLIGKDLDVKTIRHEGDRSYANDLDRSIGLEDGSPRERRKLLFHEMGHFAEFGDADSLKIASDWIKSRATGEPESLRNMTGYDFDEHEMAVPDNFFDDYVGKQYSDGFTEVHSMGFEMFSSGHKLIKLFKEDREHFNIIIRHIRQ
jgi:Phage Mu protein F like protein